MASITGAVMGGFGSMMAGGKFMDGFKHSLISSALNHAGDIVVQEIKDVINKSKPSFDIDKSVDYINKKARPSYLDAKGECALYIREALEAGGIDASIRPGHAKEYGPYLEQWGFSSVESVDYVPLKGDMAVFQNYDGGSVAGHIQMYNGSRWVSDHFQNRFWANTKYESANNYMIYRWKQPK